MPATPPGRAFRVAVDDVTLQVLDYGASSEAAAARPLLMLHGGMGHSRWWDLVAPQLTEVVHPFAVDRRGHGDSDWADPDRYGWERDLVDLETVLQRLSPLPWSLAGHSQGGLLAVHLAARRHVPIRELVLLDVPLEPQSPGLQRAGQAFRRMPQIRYPSLDHAMQRFQPFPSQHHVPAPVLEYLARHSFKPVDDGTGELTSKFHWKSYQRDRSREGNPLADHGARLAALDVPVLSVRGGDSTILSADDQAELLRRLRHGRGVEIAHATHSLHAEQPAAVAAALREFLERDA